MRLSDDSLSQQKVKQRSPGGETWVREDLMTRARAGRTSSQALGMGVCVCVEGGSVSVAGG